MSETTVRRIKKPGRGGLQRGCPGQKFFTVSFDEETADEIIVMAEKNHVSTSEQIRMLVQWGLEDADAA